MEGKIMFLMLLTVGMLFGVFRSFDKVLNQIRKINLEINELKEELIKLRNRLD